MDCHSPEVGVRFEMLHQRDFIDDGAPGRIDDDRVLLHQSQALLVDEVHRALVQVAVEAHHLQHTTAPPLELATTAKNSGLLASERQHRQLMAMHD
jgi:hypothetical protein